MSLLVVRSDGPATVKALIARAKANPGRLNMGAGTITSRLGAMLFAKVAGIELQLIPYKGSAEIVQGLLSGSIDFALDSVGSSLPMIQSGQFRALAKYSNRPLPLLPDVPSLSVAAGLPEIDESATWIGLLAPAGTPERGRRQAAGRGRAHLRRSGHAGAAAEGGAVSGEQHAGGVRRLHPQRDRALGEGDQGQQGPAARMS